MNDLSKLYKQIEKETGLRENSLINLKDHDWNIDIVRMPSGISELDKILGGKDDNFGWPRGRFCEIYGPEASGKTVIALRTIAKCQRNGGNCFFWDAEQALDKSWATKQGVIVNDLSISQENAPMERVLWAILKLIESNQFDLIVLDSVPALIPQSELDGKELGKQTIAAQARVMSASLKHMVGALGSVKTCLIFINQLRDNPSIMYGPTEVTPGGRAIKFYTSVRLEVKSSTKDRIKDVNDRIIGHVAKLRTVKNKTAPPFQTSDIEINYYDKNPKVDLIREALAKEVITYNRKIFKWVNSQGKEFKVRGDENEFVEKITSEGGKEAFDELAVAVGYQSSSDLGIEIENNDKGGKSVDDIDDLIS